MLKRYEDKFPPNLTSGQTKNWQSHNITECGVGKRWNLFDRYHSLAETRVPLLQQFFYFPVVRVAHAEFWRLEFSMWENRTNHCCSWWTAELSIEEEETWTSRLQTIWNQIIQRATALYSNCNCRPIIGVTIHDQLQGCCADKPNLLPPRIVSQIRCGTSIFNFISPKGSNV